MLKSSEFKIIPDYGETTDPNIRAKYGYLEATISIIGNILIFFINLLVVYIGNFTIDFYMFTFLIQILFYIMILLGTLLKNMKIRLKILFVPYYIFIMNYSIIHGMFRYISGSQSVTWEKAKRS